MLLRYPSTLTANFQAVDDVTLNDMVDCVHSQHWDGLTHYDYYVKPSTGIPVGNTITV